jgi:hypothetical protein
MACGQFKNPSDNGARSVTCDQGIVFNGFYSVKNYPEHLRRIRFKDTETGKKLVFLTNNAQLPAPAIAAFCKSRWQVELLFKWIKQHPRIEPFLVTGENAVKNRIWCAVATYVPIAFVKKELNVVKRSEPVSRLELTSVHGSLFRIGVVPGSACGPAQVEFRPQRKDHGRAVYLGLDTYAFLRWRQSEVKRITENNGVRLAPVGTDGGVKYLSLQQKRCRVRPIHSGDGDGAGPIDETARIDPREWTWSGDAGSPHIAKLVVWASVQRCGADCRLPDPIRRTRGLTVAGDVSLIDRLKGLDGAADIYVCLRVDRIPDPDVGDHGQRAAGVRSGLCRAWFHFRYK